MSKISLSAVSVNFALFALLATIAKADNINDLGTHTAQHGLIIVLGLVGSVSLCFMYYGCQGLRRMVRDDPGAIENGQPPAYGAALTR
jgi:hypothetical protein